MTVHTCPLCDWSINVPEPQHAPALAAVFGVTSDALASIHLQQEMRRTEAEAERHMITHKPQEWLPVIMKLRATVQQYERELTARGLGHVTKRDTSIAEQQREIRELSEQRRNLRGGAA